MTDMIERAARGICEDEGYLPDRHYPSMRYSPAWKNYRSNARAGLKVAFKVTDEDAQAFFGEQTADIEWMVLVERDGSQRILAEAMQALSDAALKEGS